MTDMKTLIPPEPDVTRLQQARDLAAGTAQVAWAMEMAARDYRKAETLAQRELAHAAFQKAEGAMLNLVSEAYGMVEEGK